MRRYLEGKKKSEWVRENEKIDNSNLPMAVKCKKNNIRKLQHAETQFIDGQREIYL